MSRRDLSLTLSLALLLACASGCPRGSSSPTASLVSTSTGYEIHSSASGVAPLPLLLGPGTSAPVLNPQLSQLSWTCPAGQASLHLQVRDDGYWLGASEVTPASGATSAVLVLPCETLLIVDQGVSPLLRIERWEGTLPDGRACVLERFLHDDSSQSNWSWQLLVAGARRQRARSSSTSTSGLVTGACAISETVDGEEISIALDGQGGGSAALSRGVNQLGNFKLTLIETLPWSPGSAEAEVAPATSVY